MNAHTANDQITFSLGNASYVDYAYDEPPVAVVKTPEHSGRQWLHSVLTTFAAWRRRRVVLREMELMSDRDLADIGLARADLPRVFDPAFAADHARGRDYIAY